MSTLVHQMAIETERRYRYERADRDRLLTEARSAHAGARLDRLAAIRKRSGGALIRIGNSLSGTPIPESGAATQPAW